MRAETVLSEDRDGILLLTINRPDVRNAVDLSVAQGIAAGLDRLDADSSLDAAVLAGAGAGFCSGLDLTTVPDGPAPEVGDRGFAGISRRSAAKPVLAAIEGFALAGGFEIALACDLIVAGRGAVLGLPEVKRALIADAGGLLRLPRHLPYHVAMEIALTGEPIGAERLAELGLVTRVVDDGEAVSATLELARRIAANAPLSLTATKRIVAGAGERTLAEEWSWQADLARPVFESEDAVEGSRAFLEKRQPVWRGR